MADENKNQNESFVDLSALGSLDFTPAWAKGKSDDKSQYARFEGRDDDADSSRNARAAGGKFGGSRRDDRGEKSNFQKFGSGNRDRGEGRERGRDRNQRRDNNAPRMEGFQRGNGERRFDRPRREFIKAFDVDVRILPDQKTLGRVIKTIQETHAAYPLKPLAFMFLEHLRSCMLRITPKKPKDGEIAATYEFHQCKACGYVVMSEEELLNHVINTHLGDYYEATEVDCEPPSGAFNCVARCSLSGELLGPPNLHGYDSRVREMVRTRFPNMSEDAYRKTIEMVRDSEVVEQWRQGATKKTIYKLKGVEDSPAIEREAAELEFRRTIAPGLLTVPKVLDISAEMAIASPAKGLVFACREALDRERRFPASLFYALRGAFHRKLKFFRANDARGPEFVTAVEMKMDEANLVAELAEIVKFVSENAFTTKAEVIKALAGDDAKKAADVKAALSNLIEMGRIVYFSEEYSGGILSLPADHPKYRPPQKQQQVKKPEAATEEKKEEVAKAAEEPTAVAEEVALVTEEEAVQEENKEEVK